jgi:hypothetical protein
MSSRRDLLDGLRTYAAEMTVAPGPVIEDFKLKANSRGCSVCGVISLVSSTDLRTIKLTCYSTGQSILRIFAVLSTQRGLLLSLYYVSSVG